MLMRLIDRGCVIPPRDHEALTDKEARELVRCQLRWRAVRQLEELRLAEERAEWNSRWRVMGLSALLGVGGGLLLCTGIPVWLHLVALGMTGTGIYLANKAIGPERPGQVRGR